MSEATSDAPKVPPTPERLTQGPVDVPAEVVTYDRAGRSQRSLAPRAVDTLGRMLRNGSITAAMARAGARFRADLQIAGLDPMKCSDVSRPRVSGLTRGAEPDRILRARDRTWAALAAVGGIGSCAGIMLWDVVGCEASIKLWVRTEQLGGRRISQETAAGVLTAALEMLVSHYEANK